MQFQWRASLFFLFIVSFFLLYFPALAQAQEPEKESIHEVEFSVWDLSVHKKDGYDVVHLPDTYLTREVAKPELPYKVIHVAIDPDKELQGIEVVIDIREPIAGSFNLYPVQPSMLPGETKPFTPPDPTVYSSRESHPKNRISVQSQGVLGGVKIATIHVYPVEYTPADKKLFLHTRISLKIIQKANGASKTIAQTVGSKRHDTFQNMVKDTVINPDDLEKEFSETKSVLSRSVQEAALIDYLIVTNTELKNSGVFQPLIDSKTARGLTCAIETVEAINATSPGRDLQEKIRSFIKEKNASDGVLWVLLGGDTNIVPGRTATVSDRRDVVTDLYYSHLDGDWDSDHDDRFGELTDDVDPYPDLFIGRAPVENVTEAQTFVEKVLTYESNVLNYRNKVLLMGTTDFNDAGRRVNDLIASEYFSDSYLITKYYQRDFPSYRTQAIEALNQGQHLINHVDHGGFDSLNTGQGIPLFISDIDQLSNRDAPSLFYAVSCNAAAIEEDAIAEHWVTNPNGGGVAFLGNTVSGYNPESDEYLSPSFYESLLRKGYRHLGQALADSKIPFVGDFNAVEGTMRYVIFALNLLGDPEMTISLEDNQQLFITSPEQGSYVQGMVDIYGSAFLPQGFQSYELYLMPQDDPEHRIPVYTSSSPVQNGFLGVWNTSEVMDRPYQLKLKMTNDQNQVITARNGVNVIVDNMNDVPEFLPLTDRRAVVGRTLEFKVEATDPDDPATPRGQLHYSVIHPFGSAAQFNPETQVFSWTPSSLTKNVFDVGFTASDDDHSVTTHVALRTLRIQETQITNNGVWPDGLSVYQNRLLWHTYGYPNNHILLYDLRSHSGPKVIADAPCLSSHPSQYGNKIVWEEGCNVDQQRDIYVLDLSAENPQPALLDLIPSGKCCSAIYENKIVWMDKRNGEWDIYMYDLDTHQEMPIAVSSWRKLDPQIYGNQIVWMDERKGDLDIYMFDLSAMEEIPISTDAFDQVMPKIYKDKIVWEDRRDGLRSVYLYDLSTGSETPIDPSPYAQRYPSIWGDRIVWEDYRNGNPDIYMYDLRTKDITQITDDSSPDLLPAIYGNKVAWNRYISGSDGSSNIFSADLIDPEELPEDVNGDCIVNIIDLSIVKQNLFKPVTAANFRSDVNADGVINIVDLSLVKTNLYKQAVACE